MARRYWSMRDRLAANSVRDPETGCLFWTGHITANGYPRVCIRVPGLKHPYSEYAHRVAWSEHHGREIPPGMSVDHLCRNTACIEPGHLELVPLADNTVRAWERRREERFGS